MLPATILNMLASLEEISGHKAQVDQLKDFGQVLLDRPEDAAGLLDAIAAMTGAGVREEQVTQLLGMALDEARMARESGQNRGAAFIDAMEARLDRLVGDDHLSFKGRLALSSSWVRAGLVPPESLAAEAGHFTGTVPDLPLGEPQEIASVFEGLFDDLLQGSDGSSSALHAMFAEMLPAAPADARCALVRIAVSRPPELFAELGCAWLLDASEAIRSAAADGLSDRFAAGHLSADVLARLTIMRSWVMDDAVKDRLDVLIREGTRQGIGGQKRRAQPKIHRIIASMVDGSGAQSMAAAFQTGSCRGVAVVLLKQGFGVKDAHVIPCASATEQRAIIAGISDELHAYDVSRDYMIQATGIALSDGIGMGRGPVPGLVEVAQSCGLGDLRPGQTAIGDLLTLADPDSRIAHLSIQARGRLIMASQSWEDRYPISSSWFEDSDAVVETLDDATSQAALKRGLWNILETRRAHWAMLIARNALLLKAAGEDHADEFVAVAAALSNGRDLKKTPVMQQVFDQSLDVWSLRESDSGGMFSDVDPDLFFDVMSSEMPADMPIPTVRTEKKGELSEFLQSASLTEPWLEGYLIGVCTAPIFISPPDWLGPLLNLIAQELESERKMERFVELLMLRYSATLSKLDAADDTPLIPREFPLVPVWADGYLTAWEANKANWPAKTLSRQDKAMRKLLENATEGRIDRTGFASMPAWLRQCFADQRM